METPGLMFFRQLHFRFTAKLYRISLALGICHGSIYLGLLSLSVLEELFCYLREQSIGKDILILLLPLSTLFLELRQLRVQGTYPANKVTKL